MRNVPTTSPSKATLVLGGARSGKSRHAEALVREAGGTPVYVATGQAGDDEMSERIAAHRRRRGADWHTVEEPLDLVGALRRECRAGRTLLVDCLTLWLSNVMLAGRDVREETAQLVAVLPELPGALILVSNEVGMGLVPETPLGRAFRDAQGRLNQDVAAVCSRVIFVAAGLPLTLKDITNGEAG